MKLALLGATGGVGREVLSQAIAAGHAVTAVVRNPSKLPADVDVVRQDLATPDADVLAAALRDVDAVISAVGPHRAAQAGIVAPATAAITEAMDCAGFRRLVVISAAPVGVVPSTHRPHPPRYDPGDDLLMRYLLSPLIRRIFGRHYVDLAAMEDLLSDGSLDWTTIRPPRLTDGPLTGRYRTAIDRNVRHGLTISRPDVAHLISPCSNSLRPYVTPSASPTSWAPGRAAKESSGGTCRNRGPSFGTEGEGTEKAVSAKPTRSTSWDSSSPACSSLSTASSRRLRPGTSRTSTTRWEPPSAS